MGYEFKKTDYNAKSEKKIRKKNINLDYYFVWIKIFLMFIFCFGFGKKVFAPEVVVLINLS